MGFSKFYRAPGGTQRRRDFLPRLIFDQRLGGVLGTYDRELLQEGERESDVREGEDKFDPMFTRCRHLQHYSINAEEFVLTSNIVELRQS